MKTKLLYIVGLSLLVASSALAQPKPKLKKPSSAAVRATYGIIPNLKEMIKQAKIPTLDKTTCDIVPYIKTLNLKKVIPRTYVAARSFDKHILNYATYWDQYHSQPRKYANVIEEFAYADTYEIFIKRVFGKDKKILEARVEKEIAAIYDSLLPLRHDGRILHQKTFRKKNCVYKVETKISFDPKQFSKSLKKAVTRPALAIKWKMVTRVDIDCTCKKRNEKSIQKATLIYTGDTWSSNGIDEGFLNFGSLTKIPVYKLEVKDLSCCPPKTPKTEDGSFIDPNEDEDIAFPNQFIEVGAGIGTAKDEETELCASVGFMHNLLPGEDNALFVGGRASIHNASFSGSDFSQTTINVGPAVEYQTFIGDTSTKWINGINGSFVFGSQNSGEFKTDISGINIGLYTGLEVPLGDQFALGVMANLLSINNLTFKTDEGEFKSNSTGINLNKGSVGLSLRVNLDSNN